MLLNILFLLLLVHQPHPQEEGNGEGEGDGERGGRGGEGGGLYSQQIRYSTVKYSSKKQKKIYDVEGKISLSSCTKLPANGVSGISLGCAPHPLSNVFDSNECFIPSTLFIF